MDIFYRVFSVDYYGNGRTYMDAGKNKIPVQHIENPIPVNTLKKQVTPDITLPQKLK
ncbi:MULTISPECIES: hypothetical protein [unclassified Chryseobacterium]|uniref:hypothetical protein n=1 Tax=unclassified Chryseobacterium TaxID=2593645 RepID=UPI0013E93B49|nr:MULTISPECIES: hypothetical protein [unclassified Chryseobacterium]